MIDIESELEKTLNDLINEIDRDPELEAWEQSRIIIPRGTYERFMALGRVWPDAWALYCHYYYTARRQKTNQIRATNPYCENGLNWRHERLIHVKKTLVQAGFIETISRRNEKGKVIEHFVKVNGIPKARIYPFKRENHTVQKSGIRTSGTPKVYEKVYQKSGYPPSGFSDRKCFNLEKEIYNTSKKSFFDSRESIPNCPQQEIVNLYHEILPELPRVKEWGSFRQGLLRARWKDKKERQNLDWWKGFFNTVKESDFLMGRINEFRADLEWLIRPRNFVKVLEGRYKNREKESNTAWNQF